MSSMSYPRIFPPVDPSLAIAIKAVFSELALKLGLEDVVLTAKMAGSERYALHLCQQLAERQSAHTESMA